MDSPRPRTRTEIKVRAHERFWPTIGQLRYQADTKFTLVRGKNLAKDSPQNEEGLLPIPAQVPTAGPQYEGAF